MEKAVMYDFGIDLYLFDGAAAGGAPAGDGATEGAEGQAEPVKAGRRAKNALADVKYGKVTEPETGGEADSGENKPPLNATSDTAEARRAEFERLIKGDYADLFQERTQKIIDARFKEAKQREAQMTALEPILDALSAKYGVDAKDIDKLQAAIDQDDSYFEAEAERRGMTVEQFKQFKHMEAENERLRQAVEAREAQEGTQRVFAQWHQQGEELKRVYPGFDLVGECQSPETGERFLRILKSGVDVRTAYEVIHKDELLSGAIGYAAQVAQQRTIDNIRARGMRPMENGASANAPAHTVKSDPSKWTKADRAEVRRRVLAGERIEL